MTDRRPDDVRQDERLTRRLAALPREIDPRRDLWQGIEARIESRPAAPPSSGSRTLARWPVWAVLAVLLIAVPWLWIELQPSDETSPAGTPNGMADLAALAWHARQEDHVFVTRQALEMALGTARETGDLTPEATAGLAEGLATLDRAIGETRAALDQDPANPQLRLLLAQRYRQEAALLYRVRSL